MRPRSSRSAARRWLSYGISSWFVATSPRRRAVSRRSLIRPPRERRAMHHESRCADPDLSPMPLSVVLPVHDARAGLARCVAALQASAMAGVDFVVVDDASSDDPAAVATPMGARILR